MLDQLVESRSNAKENTRRSGFLLTTFVIMVGLVGSGLVYSLFSKDYGLGAGDLELSTLVAPIPVAEDEPPPPPEQKPKDQPKAAPNVDTRTEIIQRMDQSPKTPEKVSVVQNTVKPPREGIATRISNSDNDAKNAAPDTYKGRGDTTGKGLAGSNADLPSDNKTGSDTAAPPPPPPPPAPKPVVPKKISGGVLNGKATSLPKPPYPAAAKAVHASGVVVVQVTINEQGAVVSASAASGHPLLRQAAEQAARQARFAPTLLSGQPVSVTGIIQYNFTAQ